MLRRLIPIAFLLCAAGAPAARIPLDPATLGGPDIFTEAERHVAAAAQSAGIPFASDPRPLPPRVILNFDTADGKIQKRNGILYWRGDMLPDQLAPGETGTLVRRLRSRPGAWRTFRAQEGVSATSRTNLVPAVRATAHFTLPPMIIETPYQLGTCGGSPAILVFWRTAEEDSPPLGAFIDLPDPAPDLVEALAARLPDFPARADWAAEFDAFSR